MKLYKKPIVICLTFLVVAVLIVFGAIKWFNKPQTTSQVQQFGYHALKIDGAYVDPKVFQQEQASFFARYSRNAAMLRKSDEERNDMMLEEIIDRMAVEDFLTRKSGLKVTAAEVSQYIHRYIKPKYSTPSAMREYLDSIFCKSETDLQRVIEIYLLKIKYFPKIADKYGITLSNREITEEYNRQKTENIQVVIRHILIAVKNHPPDESQKIANQVYDRLRKGADFSELAREYSDDLQSKNNGGLIEPLDKSIVPKDFSQKLFGAEPGRLIPPFNTDDGYEIARIEKYIVYNHPLEEIKDIMLTEKFGTSDKFRDWVNTVKAQMNIEIVDPGFLAYRFFKAGKYDQAGPLYEKIYAQKHLEAYYGSALQSYQLAQNWGKVVELGKVGIRAFPDNQFPYYLFTAEGLYHKQQIAEALADLKIAWKLAADSVVYQDLVLKTYDRLGLKRPGTGRIIWPTPIKKPSGN